MKTKCRGWVLVFAVCGLGTLLPMGSWSDHPEDEEKIDLSFSADEQVKVLQAFLDNDIKKGKGIVDQAIKPFRDLFKASDDGARSLQEKLQGIRDTDGDNYRGLEGYSGRAKEHLYGKIAREIHQAQQQIRMRGPVTAANFEKFVEGTKKRIAKASEALPKMLQKEVKTRMARHDKVYTRAKDAWHVVESSDKYLKENLTKLEQDLAQLSADIGGTPQGGTNIPPWER